MYILKDIKYEKTVLVILRSLRWVPGERAQAPPPRLRPAAVGHLEEPDSAR
jgi:hypothetical protein|tara:strand:+ start:322 stop:474 length:153 start_codon:yes stop_codon:yes gene_type:complete